MRKHSGTIGQFLLFAGVGAVGTLGHYTTLIVLVQFWAVDPVFASSFGFVIGAIINYILNYHFTFQSKKRHAEALTKFLIVAIIGAGINGFIMYIGIENTDINYMVVQLFATGVVLLWNFIVNKLWTFAHPGAETTGK
ncbi:MAG: GtrA family protein [Gammaproteobacteria bacterium]|nr:GtrA family protein [Gammaproteobacteria bacterium]